MSSMYRISSLDSKQTSLGVTLIGSDRKEYCRENSSFPLSPYVYVPWRQLRTMVAARPSTASPDPLSLHEPGDDDDDEAAEIIVVQSRTQPEGPTTPSRKHGSKNPTRTPTGRKRKAESDGEQAAAAALEQSSTSVSTLKRNPSKRAKKTVDVPGVPKPRGRAAQALKAASALEEVNAGGPNDDALDLENPSGPRTPRKKTVPRKHGEVEPTPKSTRKPRTLKAEPIGPASDDPGSSPGYSEESDDAFELDSKLSRAKFLENERRQKLNRARNFVFTGDAKEGRKLRNGKAVMVEPEDEISIDDDEDIGTAGAGDKEPDDGMEIDLGVEIDYTIPEDLFVQAEPLESPAVASTTIDQAVPPFVQERLKTILSNLSAPPSWNPTPFRTEGPENEALNSLVNLLSGTIERGEGNSCLVVGSKGSGKSRTVNRAIQIAKTVSQGSSESNPRAPIIVRLNGLAQTNDMLAIREMGRQIAQQEGQDELEEEEDTSLVVDASAPTTLPSHLLTFLTTPSARAIIVLIEGFDLFTEHARQALLYCLLDVVQSVRTGPVDSTGRGVAVIGMTSRVDTPLLLEKRVKSRFSQRIFRVVSPLALDGGSAWKSLLEDALEVSGDVDSTMSEGEKSWSADWKAMIQAILAEASLEKAVSRLCSLTTDPRLLCRPFAQMIADHLANPTLSVTASSVVARIQDQTEATGWGKKLEQLHGLSQPDLVILIIAKHFSYAGKEEFNFAMAEHEYNRFARTELAASGRTKWSASTMQAAWEHLISIGLIFPATRFRPNTNPHMQRFIMCRSLLTRSEIIGFFKGEGGKMLSTELANWGRMAGGHA